MAVWLQEILAFVGGAVGMYVVIALVVWLGRWRRG